LPSGHEGIDPHAARAYDAGGCPYRADGGARVTSSGEQTRGFILARRAGELPSVLAWRDVGRLISG